MKEPYNLNRESARKMERENSLMCRTVERRKNIETAGQGITFAVIGKYIGRKASRNRNLGKKFLADEESKRVWHIRLLRDFQATKLRTKETLSIGKVNWSEGIGKFYSLMKKPLEYENQKNIMFTTVGTRGNI